MINKIEILCPRRSCPKCRKLIRFLEDQIEEHQWDAELVIVSKWSDFLKFRTWILPSVFVNGVKVSRGYQPNTKDIIENLR